MLYNTPAVLIYRLMWERELADLNTEMERLQKESEEATQTALRDEVSLCPYLSSLHQSTITTL